MSRLRDWTVPGLIILMLLVATALLARPQDPAQKVAYSTYNPRESGLYGIYRFLEQEGQAPRRWRRPPAELPSTVSRLVVWGPPDLTDQEWRELRNWLGAAPGRTLILATQAGPSSRVWEQVASLPSPAAGGRGHLAGQPAAPPQRPTTSPRRPATPPPQPAAPPPLDQPLAAPARPARLEPWTTGVRQIAQAAPAEPLTLAWRRPVRVYLADAAGHPAALGWDEGAGQVIFFLNPGWLTNAPLLQADNLRMALGLLTGPPGSLAFSEYHLGLRDAAPPAGAPAPSPGTAPWRAVGWQLAAAVALYILQRAGRFGSPLPDPPVTPRESLEFVHALGNLYRQARARGAVTQALAAALRSSLRRLGAAGPGDAGLGQLYAARTGRPAGELLSILATLESSRHPNERDLIALARQVEELQRRVEDGNGRRRP